MTPTMVRLERNELTQDKDFAQLFQLVVQAHKVPDFTIRALEKHGGAVNDKHFAKLKKKGKKDLFISYETHTWIADDRLRSRVEAITIYDNDLEYMVERAKGLENVSDYPDKN